MQQIMIGLAHAAIGLAAALLYGASAYRVGDLVVNQRPFGPSSVRPMVCAAIGAALFSSAFSVLALLGFANRMVVIVLPTIVLMTFLLRPTSFAWMRRSWRFDLNIWPRLRTAWSIELFTKWSVWFVLAVYVAYCATFCLTPFRGNDLGIYHLVVPRDALRDGGFVYNPFFLTQGFPWGWHMFGLPAYALAGPAGYLSLSLFSFVLVLALAFRMTKMFFNQPSSIAPMSALVVAFIVGANELGSISNNDVPALFVELVALVIAVETAPSRQVTLVLGLLCGFAVAMKTMEIVGVVLILAVWIYREVSIRSRLETLAIFSSTFVPLAIFWPLVTLWHSGLPLPPLVNGPRLWGSALPAFAHTTSTYLDLFDGWMAANRARFITQQLSGNLLLWVLLGVGLFLAPTRDRRVAVFLVVFAISRIALLIMISGRPLMLFHDRYNLSSFVLIGLAAVWSSYSTLLNYRPTKNLANALLGSLIVLIAVIGLAARWTLKDPMSDGSIMKTEIPSMLEQMTAQVGSLRFGAEPQYDPVAEYIRREVPMDAVVATTSVSAFQLNHRFMQLLPMAQNVIDLDQSPAAIERALRARGVCYLHVPFSTGFNPWMDAAIRPWIDRIRQICDHPSSEILKVHTVAPGLSTRVCKLSNC